MAIPVIARGLFTRAQYFAARTSWFIGQTQRFTVHDRGLVLPVENGVGLDMIGEPVHDLMDLIRWTYTHRRGTFIDVGANVGRVLVSLARFDRSIPYVGFEPQPAPAFHCSEIIRLNGLSMTHALLPIGLSDGAGVATFYRNGEQDVSGTIDNTLWPTSAFSLRTQITLGRGDDYLADLPDVAFLKIDVEGAEIPALRGLRRTIGQHHPVIAFEVIPWSGWPADSPFAVARQRHAREIREELESHGYAIGTFASGRFNEGVDFAISTMEAYDFVAVHPAILHEFNQPATPATDRRALRDN